MVTFRKVDTTREFTIPIGDLVEADQSFIHSLDFDESRPEGHGSLGSAHRIMGEQLLEFSEIEKKKFKSLSNDIDPGRTVYGFGFKKSMEECIEHFGRPQGVLYLGDRMTLLYGKTHLFIFENNQFMHLKICDSFIPWSLQTEYEHPFFDKRTWKLGGKVTKGMNPSQVERKLKVSLTEEDGGCRRWFETRNAKVSILFSSRDDGVKQEFFLYEIEVESN